MRKRKILVLGSAGMVGSTIIRKLKEYDYKNIIGADKNIIDLRRQKDVEDYINSILPDIVIIAAARVGGNLANNTYRAQFLYDNLMIASNIIHSSYRSNVQKLIFLGTACIYPKFANQPLKEEYLLNGYLEETNEPYSIAKIAGLKLCENYYRQYKCNFLSVMPTNLFGPFDNFDLKHSHIVPALIAKIHEAKENESPNVRIWGDPDTRSEFLYVEDLADAVVFILKNIEASDIYEMKISTLNIGTGKDLTIAELAEVIKKTISYKGKIQYDSETPSDIPRKLLDVSRINKFGWNYKTSLEEGIELTYKWYRNYLRV